MQYKRLSKYRSATISHQKVVKLRFFRRLRSLFCLLKSLVCQVLLKKRDHRESDEGRMEKSRETRILKFMLVLLLC